MRASARDPATAGLPAGADVVAADLSDTASLRVALEGISRVFLYTHVEGVKGFVAAARDAGVQRVVLLSSGTVVLPGVAGNPIAEECRHVEAVLGDSGLDWTAVHPLVLANNASNWAYSIRRAHLVRMSYPAAVMAPIHERDIAAVAVTALLHPRTPGVSGLLTGGQSLSQRAQVEVIAAATGTPIRVEEQTPGEAITHLSRFMPAESAEAVVALLAAAADGGSPMTTTFGDVTGAQPASFAGWVDDHLAEFTSGATG